MKKIDIIDVKTRINKIKIFQYLDTQEKEMLIKIADYFEYYKDEKIITEGKESYCFYAVINGELNVTIEGNDKNEVQISKISEGDFFGENGIFIDDQKRTANISPIDTAQILRVGRDDFFNFIRLYPKAGVNILMLFVHELMKRLNTSNNMLASEKKELQDKIPFFENSN